MAASIMGAAVRCIASSIIGGTSSRMMSRTSSLVAMRSLMAHGRWAPKMRRETRPFSWIGRPARSYAEALIAE
jgi:hypothetical protein